MKHSWKTRKAVGKPSVDFTADMPKTMADKELIAARFGTVERMIDRAVSQWTVDVAPGIRKRLPDVAAAQRYAESYRDDGSKDTFRPSIDKADAKKRLGFTDAQLEHIASLGMTVK